MSNRKIGFAAALLLEGCKAKEIVAAVRAADESRRIGRKKLSSEQNEFKKLKLVSGKS